MSSGPFCKGRTVRLALHASRITLPCTSTCSAHRHPHLVPPFPTNASSTGRLWFNVSLCQNQAITCHYSHRHTPLTQVCLELEAPQIQNKASIGAQHNTYLGRARHLHQAAPRRTPDLTELAWYCTGVASSVAPQSATFLLQPRDTDTSPDTTVDFVH